MLDMRRFASALLLLSLSTAACGGGAPGAGAPASAPADVSALDKKDVTLLFKGSSNQRTIDVQKSRASGTVVPWDPRDTSMSPNSKI